MGNAFYLSFIDNHLIFQPSMNPTPPFQYVPVIFPPPHKSLNSRYTGDSASTGQSHGSCPLTPGWAQVWEPGAGEKAHSGIPLLSRS